MHWWEYCKPTLNSPGMAPPVRLLPSAGSLTSHEAPVLVTDSAEPWKPLLLINSICRQWFTHISVFGLQGWKSFRYRRCTVNIWGRLNIRKVETKDRKSSSWCCVYLLGIGVLPLQQGSLSSRGQDLQIKIDHDSGEYTLSYHSCFCSPKQPS